MSLPARFVGEKAVVYRFGHGKRHRQGLAGLPGAARGTWAKPKFQVGSREKRPFFNSPLSALQSGQSCVEAEMRAACLLHLRRKSRSFPAPGSQPSSSMRLMGRTARAMVSSSSTISSPPSPRRQASTSGRCVSAMLWHTQSFERA